MTGWLLREEPGTVEKGTELQGKGFPLCGDENVLKLTGGGQGPVTYNCEYTKIHEFDIVNGWIM